MYFPSRGPPQITSQKEAGGVYFQESNISGPSNDALPRLQRKPFLRGSTISMVASPGNAAGFVTNNLGCYNNNYSDAISVKSVQVGVGNQTRNTSINNRTSPYNSIHVVCRDDDKDPLLSSLMSSSSKRSLSTRSLLSTSTKSARGFGTIDTQHLPKTTLIMQREESGLTKEEIAG